MSPVCGLHRYHGWATQIPRWKQVRPSICHGFPLLGRVPDGVQRSRWGCPETIYY